MAIACTRSIPQGWEQVLFDRNYTILRSHHRPQSVGYSMLEKAGVSEVFKPTCDLVFATGEPAVRRVFCVAKVWESYFRMVGDNQEVTSRPVFGLEINDFVTTDRLLSAVTQASEALEADVAEWPAWLADGEPVPAPPATVLRLVQAR